MDALYELTDTGVFATEYTRGPWDLNHQHGGAPAALLMRAFEALEPDPDLVLLRVTYELIRPVPLGDLEVQTRMVRPGRRVQVLEGSIHADGTEVLRARAQRVRRSPVDSGAEHSSDPAGAEAAGGRLAPPPRREGGRPISFPVDHKLFPGDGMEVRFIDGDLFSRGPSTAWFHLNVPVIAGELPSPLQRLAAASDFPNGIGSELDWESYVFINPDLALYVEREPVGEWIALEGAMRTVRGGGGIAQAVLYDEQGRVGRSLQTLYVAER